MKTQFRLIGFDVRAPWTKDWEGTWNHSRRATFLLNENIKRPFSVDRNVWPSIDMGNDQGIDQPCVWADYITMMQSLSSNLQKWHKDLNYADEIAIEVLDENDQCATISCLGNNTETAHKNINLDADFSPLGYDVADSSLTSALSNCGFDANNIYSKDEMKEKFAPFLNDHGLFCDLDMACRFRAIMERKIPEHAPLFIYRILRKKYCAQNTSTKNGAGNS